MGGRKKTAKISWETHAAVVAKFSTLLAVVIIERAIEKATVNPAMIPNRAAMSLTIYNTTMLMMGNNDDKAVAMIDVSLYIVLSRYVRISLWKRLATFSCQCGTNFSAKKSVVRSRSLLRPLIAIRSEACSETRAGLSNPAFHLTGRRAQISESGPINGK